MSLERSTSRAVESVCRVGAHSPLALLTVAALATLARAQPAVGPNSFGYVAMDDALQSVSMTGAISISYGNTDDDAAPANLGVNTFNFFGTTYTGSNALYISTNGLITFGTPSPAYANGDLSSIPPFTPEQSPPAIAVLWDDWIKGDTPQVRYLIRDGDGNGDSDQLVIEWNQIRHLNTTTGGITFRAALQLNTGALPGSILLSFPDVTQGNPQYDYGASATVGIRPNGAGGQLLWSQNQAAIGVDQDSDAVLFTLLHVAQCVRLDPNPAPSGPVRFAVRFAPVNQLLTGLDLGDLSLVTTGSIVGAQIVDLVPPAGAPWDYVVTADTGTGAGTLRLDVSDDESISHPPWGGLTTSYPLGGAGAGNGAFTLGEVYTVPLSNDDCADAEVVAAPGTYAGSTTVATPDGLSGCNADGSPDVWYQFTAPSDGILKVDTCGSSFNTVLYSTFQCGVANVCEDDCQGSPCAAPDACLSLTMNAGETRWVRVAGAFGATGQFVLHVDFAPTPPNDLCANALLVTDGSYPFSTEAATSSGPGESTCLGVAGGQISNDVWYRYAAVCDGDVIVSLCGSSFNTRLAVYADTCPSGPNTAIACNDDFCSRQSRLTFPATAGDSYLIRVGGPERGDGVLTIRAPRCPQLHGPASQQPRTP